MRYSPLREYNQFVSWLAERYWFPTVSSAGQLLPQVTRGKRLSVWPTAAPLAAELDYALVGTGWHTSSGGPLETLDVNALPVGSLGVANQLPLELIAQTSTGPTTIWRGHQDLGGAITALGTDIIIQRGIGFPYQLADVLTDRPPTVFFLDGTTVHGSSEFDSRARSQSTPPGMLNALGWDQVDVTAETRAKVAQNNVGRNPPLKCVHEALEEFLVSRPKVGRRRWIRRAGRSLPVGAGLLPEVAHGVLHRRVREGDLAGLLIPVGMPAHGGGGWRVRRFSARPRPCAAGPEPV